MKRILVPALLAAASASAQAADIPVSQKDKKFSVASLKAKVGDTLVFRNDDPFFHNIFSLSDAQTFDLGSFPQGDSRKVVMKKEGTLEVECAIHPEMRLTVQVAK
jgi:plastocyanin